MQHSTPDALVCGVLLIKPATLGQIIHEDPATIRSWFTNSDAFNGNYFELCNSPMHNALHKRNQLNELVEQIGTLRHVLGSDDNVIAFLHRPRKKLGGNSLADIARNSPNPLPTDNGLQDLIERIQSWCTRKKITIPTNSAAVQA